MHQHIFIQGEYTCFGLSGSLSCSLFRLPLVFLCGCSSAVSNSARLMLSMVLVVLAMVCGGEFLIACSLGSGTATPTRTLVVLTPTASTTQSLRHLHTLLESGVADGRIKEGGKELIQIDERVQQALSIRPQPKINTAKQQLLIMQMLLVQGIGSKTIDADHGQALLASIDSISREYNLQLPSMMARPGT